MERKKTILIAVIINAALLVVLFIAALTTEDDFGSEVMVRGPAIESVNPQFSNVNDFQVQSLSNQPSPLIQVPIALKSPETQKEEIAPKIEIAQKSAVLSLEPSPQIVLPAVTVPASSTPIATSTAVKNPAGKEVTVKKGDSLDKIAKANNTTVDELIRFNQLPGSFLKIGQVLKIPDKTTSQVAVKSKVVVEKASPTAQEYYIVKVGDNPWSIAMKNHMKVDELLKLNSLNEERARKLKPGDRLRIR